tara:strand:- start:428 stop:1228 length:801 start_codon:yes stop_codon:yes gene_type:complete
MTDISDEQLNEWNKNKCINPLTKRKIKLDGPVYKKFAKIYSKKKNDDNKIDNYLNFRKNRIDPILFEELPFRGYDESSLFKFEFKWNPYTGERYNIKDEDGPLYFDPNILIHYFYMNRLNNLWIDGYYDGNDFIQGHYGDALGKYPEFEITGRGKHPEMYLFRLPIIDCYLENNHNKMIVTMGPVLTDKEVKRINSLSKKFGNYFKNTYGYKKPNLYKLKTIYDLAVSPCNEYDRNLSNDIISKEELDIIKFQINSDNVSRLINFK